MKKLKSSIVALTILVGHTNNIYATTTGTLVKNETSSLGKLLLIAVGVLLISLVLFIGYKMDKAEPISISKKRNEEKSNEMSDIYASIDENNINYEEENEIYESEINSIEYDDDHSLFSTLNDEEYEEDEFYDDIDNINEIDGIDQIDEINEIDFKEETEDTLSDLFDSTMVFNSASVNEISNEEKIDIDLDEYNEKIISKETIEKKDEKDNKKTILENTDINPDFLQEMEENLIQNKNKRLAKEENKEKTVKTSSKKSVTKKDTTKKDTKSKTTKKTSTKKKVE